MGSTQEHAMHVLRAATQSTAKHHFRASQKTGERFRGLITPIAGCKAE